jgi:nitroreductase
MRFLELARSRYSVRGYRPDPVPRDVLERLLEAARLSPSAANRQPWHMIVLDDPALIQQLKDVYPSPWLRQAPVVIILCLDPEAAWTRSQDGRKYVEVDAAIAMDHLTLAAADEGLGTCWIAAFQVQPLRQLLGVPDEVEPFLIVPLGYPSTEPTSRQRKPMDQLVHWNSWPT